MTDIFSNAYNFLQKSYQKFTQGGANAVKFYSVFFILILSFASLIPVMMMTAPCNSSNNYQNKSNCSLLGETDNDTLLEWEQDKYLALYITNIIASSLCFILAIVLLFYI